MSRAEYGRMDGRFAQAAPAIAFIMAGNATFTLRSQRTGARYTYRVRKGQQQEGSRYSEPPYFVQVLTGADNEGDYTYIGMIVDNVFRLTKASRMALDAPSVKAFRWAFERLVQGTMPEALEVWHAGRCGRCGRQLTVPESIASGFGPECINYV